MLLLIFDNLFIIIFIRYNPIDYRHLWRKLAQSEMAVHGF